MKNHASGIANAAAAALMAAGIAAFTLPAVAADIAGAPMVQTYNGIRYLNGGVGKDEEMAIKAQGRDYNVHMTFAAGQRSAYLAGVKLTVTGSKGNTVLMNGEAGPLFYAKLPAGSYHATAEINGMKQTKSFTVGNSGSVNVVFFWKNA
jgi:hypothetical protein